MRGLNSSVSCKRKQLPLQAWYRQTKHRSKHAHEAIRPSLCTAPAKQVINHVSCTGIERDLSRCSYDTTSECRSKLAVKVKCIGANPTRRLRACCVVPMPRQSRKARHLQSPFRGPASAHPPGPCSPTHPGHQTGGRGLERPVASEGQWCMGCRLQCW